MHLAVLALLSTGAIESPFIVPVAGCVMILGIVAVSVWSGVRNREIQSQERLAAIARGVAIPPTPEELAMTHGRPTSNATRRRDNVRLAAIILLCGAGGLIAFFVVLASVLHERDVLCGAAAGLIPLGIGVGLFLDARLQTRQLDEATTGNHLSA
jgi:hypothetical protein